MWDVETTDQFAAWYRGLEDNDEESVTVAVEQLQANGPALRRPLVDVIKQSALKNMKELIPLGGRNIRILFAFDPRRTAILLLGGDKSNDWDEWYDRNVPIAEQLYAEYLHELRHEGLLS